MIVVLYCTGIPVFYFVCGDCGTVLYCTGIPVLYFVCIDCGTVLYWHTCIMFCM